MHWSHRLHELSLEQLEQLIREIGPVASLTRELDVKALMAKVEGLKRELALPLVTAPEDRIDEGDSHRKALTQLLINNQPSKVELMELSQHLGGYGQKIFVRAVRHYGNDATRRGLNSVVEEILLKLQQKAAEDGRIDGDEASEDFDQTAEEIAPDLEMRQVLADEWDIHSPADFEMMIQAMALIAKEEPNLWIQSGRSAQHQQTSKARRLYEEAKRYGCTPQCIVDWRIAQNKPMNPNAIYKRPDGLQIWGNGDPVVMDKQGNPRRPMSTFFGQKLDGEVPHDFEMRDWVKRAYPNG